MGKIQENDARLQQLVSMARIGWWEVDFDEGVYYCSEFVADLLGIEGNKISVSRKKKNPTLAKKKSHKSVTNSLSF